MCTLLATLAPLSHAALGAADSTVGRERMQLRARHQASSAAQYTVHVLTEPNGAVLRQFVNRQGRVFAVQWTSPLQPDLGTLLGADHAQYREASAQRAQTQVGPQRQLQHSGPDLVLHARSHLNIFRGYAYKPSLLPQGLDPQQLGLQ